MKTDRYTKSVLTVTTIALCIIALKDANLFPNAHASSNTNTAITNSNYGLIPVNEDGSTTVRLSTTSNWM